VGHKSYVLKKHKSHNPYPEHPHDHAELPALRQPEREHYTDEPVDHFFHGIHSTQGVGYMCEGNQPGFSENSVLYFSGSNSPLLSKGKILR